MKNLDKKTAEAYLYESCLKKAIASQQTAPVPFTYFAGD
jgi:hypothetical protein